MPCMPIQREKASNQPVPLFRSLSCCALQGVRGRRGLGYFGTAAAAPTENSAARLASSGPGCPPPTVTR